MRIQVDSDVDLLTLGAELEAALNRPVALTARPPGQVDDNGQPLPGVVVLLHPDTGEPLNVAPGLVDVIHQVITAHAPPPPWKTPIEDLDEALAAATDVTSLKAALRTYTGLLAEREARLRARRGRRPGP